MLRNLRQLIERQILKAKAEGKLENLAGQGRPLPDRSAEAFVDPAEAAAIRMMAEAGAVPEEFRLKAQLDAARRDWQDATDEAAKKVLMAKIADLSLKYETAREARKKFLR